MEIESVGDETVAESGDSLDNPYLVTEEDLKQRVKHEDRGQYIRQLYAAIVGGIAAFSFGTVLGWSSPNLSELGLPQDKQIQQHSWIAAMVPLGCSLGVLPFSYFNVKLGPKRTMLIQGPFYIIAWILMASIKTLNSFLAGRFFCGFLSISHMISGETLLVDCVHRGYMTQMMTIFRMSVFLGIGLTYVLSQSLPPTILTGICALIGCVHFLVLTVTPDSPVYLYEKSKLKAEKSLCWYRGHTHVYTEMNKIKQDAEHRKLDADASGSMMYAEVVMKGIAIVLGLNFFQVFSGYFIFMFYSVDMLNVDEEHNIKEDSNPMIHHFIYVATLFIANLTGTLVHQRNPFGVRKPLMWSTFLVTVCLLAITVYLYMPHFFDTVEELGFSWFLLIAICFLVISYEVGLGTYPEIILYYYMPYQVYEKAKFTCTFVYWFIVFLMVKNFVRIRNATDDYVAFAILTVISLVGVCYCYFFVIETKGKSLVQIQLEIGGNPIGTRGAHRQRAA